MLYSISIGTRSAEYAGQLGPVHKYYERLILIIRETTIGSEIQERQ